MTFLPTPEQRKAIEHHTGPMLVVAGAGSGKTTVLVERIAWLIREKGVAPDEILALTYTINAAARMRRGVQQALGRDFNAESLRAQNFHGYCNQLLQKHSKGFIPLEEEDLKVYLNLHVRDLPLKVFSKAASPGEFIVDLLKFNDRCQDDLVSAEDYKTYVASLQSDPGLKLPRVGDAKKEMSRDEVLARCSEIAAVYAYVTDLLKKRGWGTFGSMVIEAVALLRDRIILEEECARTKFILVDEFQDTNFGQIELVQMLGGNAANIFAVGDPDQAIYRFRGATSVAFDEFRKRFPQTREATLSMNYRSTPVILDTAYAVISANKMAERKPLVSGRDEAAKAAGGSLPQDLPEIVVTPDFVTEAKTVVDEIEAQQQETGCRWSDFAVLYRQHDHRSEVMAELVARGIPYEARNTDVLCAPEVRDAVALMHAVVDPDDAVSHFRIAAMSRFKVDREELRLVLSNAKRGAAIATVLGEVKNGKRVLDAIAQARKKIDGLKTGAAGALDVLIKEFAVPTVPELNVFRAFVRKWQGKPIAERTTLESFCEYLDCFVSVGGKVMINADGDKLAEIPNAVQLMTAHSAKGLEFKHVFVVRANSNAFPASQRDALFEFPWELSRSQLSIADIPDSKELHKQEERQLFYVACTRAEDSLKMLGRPHWQSKKPTGYLRELSEDKSLKDKLVMRRVEQSRIDLQAATAALSLAAEWVLDQPAQLRLGQLKLSASSIECYTQCGLKYWLRHNWKMPEEPAAQLQYGSVIHQVLRGYYEAIRAGQKLDLETVLTAFRDGIENAKLEDRHQERLYIEQGIRQLTALVESRKHVPSPKVLYTEKTFHFEIDDILVTGRMDRVDELSGDAVAIEDYKTGKARNEKFAEDSLQLTIYAMAAKRDGKTAAEVRIYNLENDSVISVTRGAKELADGEKEIRKAAAGIRAGQFVAKPGFHCRYCAYAAVCPAKEERIFALTQIAGVVR